MSSLNVCFPTTTPPVIRPGTIVVAATAPSIAAGLSVGDESYLSDFYAFNYLLEGVAGKQVWLSTTVSVSAFSLFLPYVEEDFGGNVTAVAQVLTCPISTGSRRADPIRPSSH